MRYLYRLFCVATLALAVSCVSEQTVDFMVDTETIQVGPEGGVRKVRVDAAERWVASTQQPWITVSPANGRASSVCEILIDTTLLWNEQREGEVFFTGENSKSQSFRVIQKGYDYQIVADKPEVNIDDYADYGKRKFTVKVKTNVDFNVRVPASAQNWLKYKKSKLNLDRQARPREVTLDFEWDINSTPLQRIAGVYLEPVKSVSMGQHDSVKVVQKAAPEIEVGTIKGDSLALLAIHRALGVWSDGYDTSERLENWSGVTVWRTKDERNGRVRSATFFGIETKEGLPYEIQYLTAVEELYIYGNSNTFLLYNLDCGPHICKLTQLRKLTIGAYGLTSLHEDFKNLKNLEYLDLSSNNFQKIPDCVNPVDLPKLTAFEMSANGRHAILDLSNETRENIGGLIEEPGFPTRFLTWNQLDTIRFSYNYLQGTLPSDEEIEDILMAAHGKVEYWSSSDVQIKDSIAVDNTFFETHKIPKVLPDTDFFVINLNRLYGELPNWLLYHPKLDLWAPTVLVFPQDGIAQNGTKAQFSNAPTNMNYYYDDLYINKKYNPKNFKEE